jgi:hypothetical protein
MQPTLQPTEPTQAAQARQPAQATQPVPQLDPQSDPHDAIVALLRGAEPRWTDPSELNITPVDTAAFEKTSLAPPIEPALPSEPLNGRVRLKPPRRERAGRGLVRFVLTVCVGIAATVGWQAYGEEAKQMFANLAPQLLAQLPAQAQTNAAAEPQAAAPAEPAQIAETQPAADDVTQQPAATTAAAAAPAQPPAAPPVEAAAAQTPVPPEVTQSLDAMGREIAQLKQTIEELRVGQQQLTRELAKAAEQEAKRKASAQKPKPATPPQRAAAAPLPPVQAAPAPRPMSYPSSQPYASSQGAPPPQTYGQAYPQPSVQRDAYIPPPPPPRTLPPEPGFGATPRPPMPLQ